MRSGPRDVVIACSVLLAVLAAVGTSFAAVGPGAIVVTDTTMSLSPTGGSDSQTFTAVLAYTPKSGACPVTATKVSFTWDGYALGSSQMHGQTSPCGAVLTTKPLRGHTRDGDHQVCGSFSYNGSHRGCAPFRVTSPASPGSHNKEGSSPKASSAPATSSSDRPRSPGARASSPRPGRSQPAVTDRAAVDLPGRRARNGAGAGAIVVAALGGLALGVALTLAAGRARRRRSEG